MQQAKSPFRYDINGLRAIAIMGVLLFHYKVPAFAGGFAGVDVFFVISGYLMSRVVMGQVAKGTFSFATYFERRLHRIVPALLVLVATVMLLCFFIYFPVDYKANLNNAASSVLFVSNIFYWYDAPSYFDAATDTNLFLHTWSLSVEWQFYLFYPLLLLLLNKFFKRRRNYVTAFITVTVVTIIASFVITRYDASGSFYMLPTRSWEMLFGGLAFFAEDKIKSILWRRVVAIAGYIIILSSFFTFTDSLAWPGICTLVPVTGTFLIIVANYNNFILVKNSAFQFIGKISYSLYLWHWPVFVIAQYYGLGTGWLAVMGYCVLSGMLGYLSYKYIEPIAFKGKKVILTAMAGLFALLFCLAYFNINEALYSRKTLDVAKYKVQTDPFYAQFRKDTCFTEGMRKYKKEACLCFEGGRKNILLIGDSHMAMLSQSLREGYKGKVNFLQAIAPGTLPTIESYYDKGNNYRDMMDYMFSDFIHNNAGRIEGVVISGNWAGQRSIGPKGILAGLKEALTYLELHNIPVVIVGQTERYTVNYPVVAARSFQYGTNNNSFYLDPYTQQIDALLKNGLKGRYVQVINSAVFPPLSSKGEPYMRDEDHVTKYGADLLVQKLRGDKVWEAFMEGM